MEHCAQRVYAQLVQVVADFRLVRLEQLFKKSAQRQNTLWVGANALQMAEVLAVEGPENKVKLFLLVGDVAKRCDVPREVLHRKHRRGWK